MQRDILPIVEGTTVNTKYGMVSTDHILFIAAGAFHVSKPSDLIPELQGRFPIRVELKSLTVEDFVRILTEPKSSLVKQSTALLETEGLKLEFTPEALAEMAHFAFQVNETTENIGARRLHTILEQVLDEISFQAPDLFKSPRTEVTEEGVVGEIKASVPLKGELMAGLPAARHRAADRHWGRKGDRGRSRVRAPAGRLDREGSGPLALHPVAFTVPVSHISTVDLWKTGRKCSALRAKGPLYTSPGRRPGYPTTKTRER